MMRQLSPKKYIETKARSLPIYKCLVNKDWVESKIADVIVMRKHSNDHITAGVYLVDLLCLGVKDTFFFFNEPEQHLEDRYGVEFYQIFKEIDYKLAHNIIYAGHDFAMEYDIHPHKDFAITQYILEEDTEDIPIVDIAVGSEDGKPHLIVSHQNQFPDALAKLKRIAGEGNYHYTIGEELDKMDELEEEEIVDDEFDLNEKGISLDEIPKGEINTINVQDVFLDDLMNPEKVKERTILEQVIINAESLTRVLPDEFTNLRSDEESRWELIWNEILDQAELPSGMDQGIMDDFYKATDELIEGEEQMGDKEVSEEAFSNHLMKVLDAHSANPMVVANMYETSTALLLEGVVEKSKSYVNNLQQQYPYLQISLALCSLLNGTRDLRFSNIYNAKTIKNALPQVKQFYSLEVINFWLIKLLLNLEEGKLKDAVQYYYLVRETQVNEWLLEAVLMKYNEALLTYYKSTTLDSKQH